MTAPLTPRDNQPPEEPQNPFAAPSAGGSPADPGAYPADKGDPEHAPDHARELREAAVIALAVAVSGALLGVLWAWLAPHVPLVSDAKSVYLKNTEGEEAIGADSVFALLAVGFGLLTTGGVFLFRRNGGIPLVVALVVGGVLGAVLAWRLGVWLGPAQDVVAHARQVGPGVTFDSPLRLEAKGVLLAWPITSMLAQLLLTALFAPFDTGTPRLVPDWSDYHRENPPAADGRPTADEPKPDDGPER
ncbi:ABC transporter permease [Streptomyces piniterrae]|uniref:ABC transporter permease n=1 Tax=Streptomyces piniterrae TaxID=2571125 RepID=A0A4U0NB04_9ACTN|nr:ABC transporter permease [Streptomyces piniterrae]TJZ50996.1 ABC transporter permease [Streptomyces piniterrae]